MLFSPGSSFRMADYVAMGGSPTRMERDTQLERQVLELLAALLGE